MKHLAGTIGLALLLATSSARADLNEVFDNAFGAMINTTAPGAYSGSTRGILVGGSIEVRTKLTQAPNLLGITRPRIKAGCGGISIFGGSFSAINLDEFTEYLRSVMSNSLGYLFKIGIESICPSCSNVLDSLESFVSKVNSYMKDSCQMGILLAEKSGLADSFRFEELDAFNQATTAFSNTVEGFVKAMPSADEVSVLTNSIDAEETRKAFEGNIVYIAMKRADSATRFQPTASASSKKRLLEYIQSITGTIVYVKQADGQILPIDYRPTMTVDQMLGGPNLKPADKQAVVLICNTDTADLCAKPTEFTDTTFLPMADRVSHLMLGGSGQSARGLDNTPGIAERVKTDTPLAAQELSMLQSTKLPVMGMLIDARPYPAIVTQFAEQLTPLIAIDILDSAVTQILREVERALAQKALNSSEPKVIALQGRLTEIKRELAEHVKKVQAQEIVLADVLEKHKLVRESLNGRTNMNLSPGSDVSIPR